MKLFTSKPGFTLIETLFAVLMFTTSLVALMAVAGKGIASNITAREDLTARYLALEGLEVARNTRDSNYVAGISWDETLSTCGGGCDIDYLLEPILNPNGTGRMFLSNGSYSPIPNGIEVPFIRIITIDYTDSDELKVVSRVEWQSKSVQRSVEYVDYLKKWR